MEANLDRKSSMSIIKHLQMRGCTCDGVEVGGKELVAPLCWSEVCVSVFFLCVLCVA